MLEVRAHLSSCDAGHHPSHSLAAKAIAIDALPTKHLKFIFKYA